MRTKILITLALIVAISSQSVYAVGNLDPITGDSFSDGLFTGMEQAEYYNTDTQMIITSPDAVTRCVGDIWLNLGEEYTVQELLDFALFTAPEQEALGEWVFHGAYYSGSCVESDTDQFPYYFTLTEASTTEVATSSPTTGDVVLGLAIIITLMSIMLVAYIFNSLKKPWH